MIQKTLIFTFLFFLFACDEDIENNNGIPLGHTKNETINPPQSIDSTKNDSPKVDSLDMNEKLVPNRKLERFHYPNMSRCGGDLTGFYDAVGLVKIQSRYGAEFSFSNIDVEFINGEITTISSSEHSADYEMYSKMHPDAQYIQEDKLTFTDTSYLIQFGATTSFKKYAGKKLVSTEMDERKLQELINCINSMKDELDSERKN